MTNATVVVADGKVREIRSGFADPAAVGLPANTAVINLRDKVAVITGSAVGIGREIAVAYAREGAKVVVNFSKSAAEADETARLVREAGGEAAVVQADVTKDEEARRLIEAAGMKGARRGGAYVSPKHANFIINDGIATATDIEGLMEDIRSRVLAMAGVRLEHEVRIVGEALP